MTVTRFAPSPNGPLHLGHAYSAIVAHDLAREGRGRFLLRIEDIDGPRSARNWRTNFGAICEWLGLEWEEVPAQSTRLTTYDAAARSLHDCGLLYPCTCTRADIAALKRVWDSHGPSIPAPARAALVDLGKPAALRLDIDRAMAESGHLYWEDALAGQQAQTPAWVATSSWCAKITRKLSPGRDLGRCG